MSGIKNPALLKKMQELEEKKMQVEAKTSTAKKKERQVIGWTAIIAVGKVYVLSRDVDQLVGSYHKQYTDDQGYLVGVLRELIYDGDDAKSKCTAKISEMKQNGWVLEAVDSARIYG